jgi:hypothetical protein
VRHLTKPASAGLFLTLFLCTLLSAFPVADATSCPIVINEFMADNKSTIISDQGNYGDWIELYNTADYDVDVSGMFLTDNLTTYRWQIPSNVTIQAHGYLLIWADGNFRVGELHTNFKLDEDGETIALYSTDGSLVDLVEFDEQVEDVSFGRTVDGGSSWNYNIEPTPGEANSVDTSMVAGYPWPVWAVSVALLAAVCLAVFRNKIFRRKQKC